MKGTIENMTFEAGQVNYMGQYVTYVNIPKDKTSKAELIGMHRNGTISKWAEYSDRYEIEIETNKIKWED